MDVRSLAYVRIESTDLDKWMDFGTNIVGMMKAPNMPDDGNVYLKMDAYPYRFCVFPGSEDRFDCAGWEVPGPEAFEQAIAELQAAGIEVNHGSAEEAAARKVRGFVHFKDPAGHRVELCYNMKLDYSPMISPVGIAEFETGYHGDMGLGHIAAATPCFEQSHEFYTKVMGFGQVDYMHFHFNPDPEDPGQGLHFLHANNPRHHSLALFQDQNPHPGNLVHMMVEVKTMDELGHFMDRIHASGTKVVTGMGRHTNDRMVSMYVESPAGFALEFGFDGVKVDWDNYTPTESAAPSVWGHRWNQG
jgi:3,4-dihydroxy-9,10-secoandrosta-1,3,5(10)-triene-9,17-dione 4,5-dioxygenase